MGCDVSARLGTYVLRDLTPSAREFVCEFPGAARHCNRIAERERAHEKLVRSFQRMRTDDRRWASAIASPWTLPAAVRRLAFRCARRSKVMYGRMAAKGGVR